MPYLLFADRVRRGSRALAAVFREAPRGIRDGWRNARSVRPADALTRPLARGGALRLVVRSPLIPFVDPLPLPGGCRHRGPSLRLSRPMGAARSARTRSSRGGGSHALPTYRLRPASHRHRIPRAGGGPHPGRNDRVCQHGSRQPRPSSIQRSRPIRYHPRQHGRHAELRQRCALLLGLTPGPARTRPSPDRDGPAHAQPAPYRTSPVVVDDRGHRTHPLCPSNSTPDTEPANQPRAE